METSRSTIEAVLSRLPEHELPTSVSSWHVETGSDSTDDPAVWVWAMLKDDEVEFDKRLKLRSLIRERIEQEIGAAMIIYIRFRGASEEAEKER